jgi:hypothetical protein
MPLLVERSLFPDDRPLPIQFYEWPPHAADDVCLKKEKWAQSKRLLHVSTFSVSSTVILCVRYNPNAFFELGCEGRVSLAVGLVS